MSVAKLLQKPCHVGPLAYMCFLHERQNQKGKEPANDDQFTAPWTNTDEELVLQSSLARVPPTWGSAKGMRACQKNACSSENSVNTALGFSASAQEARGTSARTMLV